MLVGFLSHSYHTMTIEAMSFSQLKVHMVFAAARGPDGQIERFQDIATTQKRFEKGN